MMDLKDKGLGLAAISYDPMEVISAFSRQRGITFPLLSDADSATIKRYGLLNTVVEEALGPNKDDPVVKADTQKYVSVVGVRPFMAGIAFPGTFMLDRSGRVTARYFEDFYIERNTVSSVLVRTGAGKAEANATKISAAHLELITYPSESEVAPGNRLSLVLDITPGRGIHVYAPGAQGYRKVTLTVVPYANIRLLPLDYPDSEVYFFKPLNERVPVYQKRFRLLQDVIVEGTPQAQAALRGKDSLTLSGSLEYQACDDKECFNPVSIALTWKLALRPLVVERPSVPK
jgi:peroxiredoxin